MTYPKLVQNYMEGDGERASRRVGVSGSYDPDLYDAGKIDISLLNICMDKLDTNTITDINTLKTMNQFSFDSRMKEADPGAFGRGTGNNCIKSFTDS